MALEIAAEIVSQGLLNVGRRSSVMAILNRWDGGMVGCQTDNAWIPCFYELDTPEIAGYCFLDGLYMRCSAWCFIVIPGGTLLTELGQAAEVHICPHRSPQPAVRNVPSKPASISEISFMNLSGSHCMTNF
jgi:hypothetical protein